MTINLLKTNTIGTKQIGKVFSNGKMVGRYSTRPTGHTEFRTAIDRQTWTFDSTDAMITYLSQK